MRHQTQVSPLILRFASSRLRQLQPTLRQRSVGLLQFGGRAASILDRQRINLIGRLIDAARHGLSLPGAGIKSFAEIEEALNSLSLSIGRDGRVDWLRYATRRRFMILPAKESIGLSKQQFVRVLPAVLEAAVDSSYGPSGKLVLQRCLLGNTREPATLEQIGRGLGITKQGASLKKEKILRTLRGAIFDDDYRRCRFRFRDAFVVPFRDLKRALDKTRGAALSHADWDLILAQTWGLAAAEVAHIETLLFTLLRRRAMQPSGPQAKPIVLSKDRSVLTFRNALDETARLLTRRFPGGLSKRQLLRELRRAKDSAPELSDVPALLGAISVLEHEPKRTIRARLEEIPRLADQLERVFRERGGPMHIRELASEIRRYRARTGSIPTHRSVGTALSADRRFKVIGRSGVWILSQWGHIETRTVASIAADLIRQAGRPLTEDELFELISLRRSVRKRSIMSLLREDGRFRRTAPSTWDLK